MASIKEDVMLAVLTRLKTTTPIVAKPASIRRAHRTAVPREAAEAVHLVDGTDTPINPRDNCETEREMDFTVSLFLRGDDAYAAADVLERKVMDRLNPESTSYQPYPHKARMKVGRITTDSEIGDLDPLRVDMEFSFKYRVKGWSLDAEP